MPPTSCMFCLVSKWDDAPCTCASSIMFFCCNNNNNNNCYYNNNSNNHNNDIYIIYIFNIYYAIKLCQLVSLLITPAAASPYTQQQLCMQTLKTVMHASCSWMLVDAPAGVDSRTGRLSCLTAHADYIMYKLGSYSVSPWKQLSMCAPGCRLGRLLL